MVNCSSNRQYGVAFNVALPTGQLDGPVPGHHVLVDSLHRHQNVVIWSRTRLRGDSSHLQHYVQDV